MLKYGVMPYRPMPLAETGRSRKRGADESARADHRVL